ncbi:hypothetical protein BDZ91DRAFT_453260 [Kalaharituber pfeilii]|nr:hypothetical protein BDZ91DRAFT_453260 [Kalaharituber pfeilii]
MTKLPPAIFLIIPHPSPLRRLRGPLTASHPTAASTVQQKSRRKEAEKQRKNKKQQPSGRQKKTQEPKARNSTKEPIEQTNSETSSKIGSEKQTSNPSTVFDQITRTQNPSRRAIISRPGSGKQFPHQTIPSIPCSSLLFHLHLVLQ